MSTTITDTFITDLCSTAHETEEITHLLAALAACDNGTLEPYLATLSMGQAWDLYDIACDLDMGINDNITPYDEDFVSAVHWIALSAAAAGQGHIH